MLGFALVGCGRIARKHAGNLGENKVPGANLVAVCDLDHEKAKFYGEKYNVPFFTDMHQMAKEMNDKIDVFSILTPSGDHAAHTIELAPYKKHILVEKPMALTMSDGEKMIHACEEHGVRLFVVKQNRFNYPVIKLREALESNRFGKLVMGTIRVRWCRDQNYYDQASWRGTWKEDGGVLANQASHHVDLLHWMMGEVESVTAKSTRSLVNIEAEDTAVAIVKFKNGALGVIETTNATRPKDLEGSISILGANGSVEIGGFAVNEMKVWNFTDERDEDKEVVSKYKVNPPDVYGFGHTEYLKDVVQAIEMKKPSLVEGKDGYKSLELISALYESIESGQEVTLPFTPKHCKLGR